MKCFQRALSLSGLLFISLSSPALAGVQRQIQEDYASRYVNRAIFLKIPVRGARQTLMLRQGGFTPVRNSGDLGLTFKVSEQVRITKVDFHNQEIRFELSSIDMARSNQLVFRFPYSLQDEFPQRQLFDDALDGAFTQGLTNREIDAARRDYLKREFRRIVRELSDNSNSPSGFVMQTLADEIPGVSEARSEAARATSELARVRSKLDEESDARRKAQADLSRLRDQSSRDETVIDTLKQERETLVEEKADLQRRINRQTSDLNRYKTQIDDLAKNLNLRTSSNADLSRSISDLNQTIDDLKGERDDLQSSLVETRSDLDEQSKRNQDLSGQLNRTRSERDRLRRNLRNLTSDKNSLSSRFVEASNQRDALQSALQLIDSLRFDSRHETREEGEFLIAELFLKKHKIGSLVAALPDEPGRSFRVGFTVDSPDTVEFDEEERRLYSALGEQFTVESAWRSLDGEAGLEIALAEGEARQSVPARETAQWSYSFEGALDQTRRVVLETRLISAQGHPIPLAAHEVSLEPDGFSQYLGGGFAPLWLVAGTALGVLGMLPVLVFRARPPKKSRPPQQKRESVHPVEQRPYVSEKRF